MAVISEQEKKERENNELYFKSGKPKKKYMLCRDPEYLREIYHINGYCSIDWICGGNRCPFYSCGCDDRGRDWEK